MPAAPKWTTEKIVSAAIGFVDEHGVDSLTLRSLGEMLGMSHTAIYRYYSSKGELLTDMVESLIKTVVAVDDAGKATPKEQLIELATRLRAVMRAHPNMIVALVFSSGKMPNAAKLTEKTAQLLRDMGLTGNELVRWHRILESHVMGSIFYDFAGAPSHLQVRQQRMKALGGPEFKAVASSPKKIEAENEAAFAQGLAHLVDIAATHAKN